MAKQTPLRLKISINTSVEVFIFIMQFKWLQNTRFSPGGLLAAFRTAGSFVKHFHLDSSHALSWLSPLAMASPPRVILSLHCRGPRATASGTAFLLQPPSLGLGGLLSVLWFEKFATEDAQISISSLPCSLHPTWRSSWSLVRPGG